jgi:hypothetical protein
MEWLHLLYGGAGGAAGAILTAITAFAIQWRRAEGDEKRTKRMDTIKEWKDIVAQQQEDILTLKQEITELRNDHHKCLVQHAAMAKEVEYLKAEITELKRERQ